MLKTAIQTRILSGFDDPSFGREAWERLLHTGETDTVFLTWEWQRVWWEVFGRGELLLVVAERDGEVTALAPLYTDEGMIYFVGSGGSDYLDFIGDTSDPDVLDALLETAREYVPGFLGFEFYMLLDSSRTGARLEAAAKRLGLDCCNFDDLAAPALNLFRQPDVAQAATKKKSLVRHENYFRREGTLVIQHACEAEVVLPQLEEFFAQHIARWAATDSPSLFLNPAWRTFYQRWTEAASKRGWLRFMRVEWNGQPIAFHFGFNYQGQFMWYKPSFEIAQARHSPGEVLLRQLLLAAIDEGAHVFDFGIGDEEFKYRFATEVNRVRTWGLYPVPMSTHVEG